MLKSVGYYPNNNTHKTPIQAAQANAHADVVAFLERQQRHTVALHEAKRKLVQKQKHALGMRF